MWVAIEKYLWQLILLEKKQSINRNIFAKADAQKVESEIKILDQAYRNYLSQIFNKITIICLALVPN